MTWEDARSAAESAWRERWKRERPPEPERRFRYTVTFECTWEVWKSVMTALKGFPISNRSYRQEEIPGRR